MPQTRITTLPNGFRVASENLDAETATVGVYIDAGSRFESERTNGAAHFLEHMAFKVRLILTGKGTKKRTKNGLELEIENMGGHLNAYTSREQTVYYAKVFKKDIGRAVEILSDILQNSTLDEANIENERSVILREQEEVEKQMEEVIFDHLHSVAFQGTSLGRTILGSRENIMTLSRNDLVNYIKKNYVGPKMVLAASGGINHEELVKLAEQHFGQLPSKASLAKPEPAVFTGSEIRIPDTTMDNAHMVIAVQGASWTSPDYFPLLVAQSIVGSWDRSLAGGANLSSKLAQVVQQHQLAQSFMSFNTSYSDTGLFGIYMVSDRKHGLDDLIYEVQQEWVRICLNVTEGEVARAKQQLKAALLMSLDGTTNICEDIGRQMLTFGKRLSIQEIDSIIDSIDAKTVRRVASNYLYDQCPAVAAIGPIQTMPDYNRIRAATLWLRN